MFIFPLGFVMGPLVVPHILNVLLPLNVSRQSSLCYYSEYFIDQEKYIFYLALHTFVVVFIIAVIAVAGITTYIKSVLHAVGLFKTIE